MSDFEQNKPSSENPEMEITDGDLMAFIDKITDRFLLQDWHGEFLKSHFELMRSDIVKVYQEAKNLGGVSMLHRRTEFRKFKNKIVREKRLEDDLKTRYKPPTKN